MIYLLTLALLTGAPSLAWAYVPHEYPAVYTHQIARIFLFFAFLVVLFALVRNRLHLQKGWRYLYLSLLLFLLWNLSVFTGRIAEFLTIVQTIGSSEGLQYFDRSIRIDRFAYLYYIGRLDFILLNAAMLLFYSGLRELTQKAQESSRVLVPGIVPLLPVLVTEIAGNSLFIVISMMSLHASIKLYKTDRENVMGNYLVWLSAAWFMYSLSRSFGHILRHILLPAGYQNVWNFLEPITGSFNIFTLFLVGSVSIFFVSVYKSYLKITEEKIKLQELVAERTQFIEQLEKDKIKLTELDKMKSAFLATVSHELRTPLNLIIGYTDLLLDRVDGTVNEEQEKSLRKVKESSQRLKKLIDDMMNISQIESAEMSLDVDEVPLKELIEAVLHDFEPLIKQKGLSLSLRLSPDLPVIFGDEEKVRHILMHLLSNAVKFTHSGGITITTNLCEQDMKSGEPPQFLQICIEDTGIGMKEEDMNKIFKMFVQLDFALIRQYGGAGLGLSIVKGLVELHKGKVWAKSTYGIGSTFCFTLPLRREILGP
jgi:signal transduction histidine kinase